MSGIEGDYLGKDPTSKLTLNVAFLTEIKEDNVQFNELIKSIANALGVEAKIQPRVLFELLSSLRDEIETYFALEEFYGYIDQAVLINPQVSQQIRSLRDEHESLFLELHGLVEEAERIVYQEVPQGRPLAEIIEGFFNFYQAFSHHEEKEMELAMRLANEEIGVGD